MSTERKQTVGAPATADRVRGLDDAHHEEDRTMLVASELRHGVVTILEVPNLEGGKKIESEQLEHSRSMRHSKILFAHSMIKIIHQSTDTAAGLGQMNLRCSRGRGG